MERPRKWEVKTVELAEILGITPRRVNQLTKSGVLELVNRDKYILNDAVQKYMHYKLDRLARQYNQTADIAIAAANIKQAEYVRLADRTDKLNRALSRKLQHEIGFDEEFDVYLSEFDVDLDQFI